MQQYKLAIHVISALLDEALLAFRSSSLAKTNKFGSVTTARTEIVWRSGAMLRIFAWQIRDESSCVLCLSSFTSS